MASIANITVYDGASTPVAHTLYPIQIVRSSTANKVQAEWREQLPSVPAYAQVSIFASMERTKNGVYLCTGRVQVPVMESIAGNNAAGYTAAPAVAYIDTIEVVGKFHQRSTLTDRRLCRQLFVNLMNGVTTSVAPNTSGPFELLYDSLILPT